MGRRRIFTSEFKESALALYHSSGKSAKDVADELGLERTSVSRWLRESKAAETGSTKAFPGQGNPRDEELARLKKENADLRETNEILKKAMAFFVVKNPR
jgi:transposase-like protein